MRERVIERYMERERESLWGSLREIFGEVFGVSNLIYPLPLK